MKPHMTSPSLKLFRRNGFSLLEVTIALSISGVLLSGIWQLAGNAQQQRSVSALVGQTLAVTRAAQNYINGNRAALMALSGLSALNSAVRVKITSSDTGATSDSLQGAGYLPANFVNLNSFGQSYVLMVKREDGGTIGVADSGDRLAGLLVTTSGTAISDDLSVKVASSIGAAGGYVETGTLSLKGTAGGWEITSPAASWSFAPGILSAGHVAVLVNLLPSPANGGGSGIAANIDELTDGVANYTTTFSMYLGEGAGQYAGNTDRTNTYNAAIGYNAMQYLGSTGNTLNSQGVALGYNALRGSTTNPVSGVSNVALGAYALELYTTGSYNTAIGAYADQNVTTGSYRTSVGYRAGNNCLGNFNTFVGSYTGACVSGAAATTESTLIGNNVGRNNAGSYNTLIGNNIGSTNYVTGTYNTALGYQALRDMTVGSDNNVALGYLAGANLTSGDYNIMIGASTVAPNPAGNYQLNIGNVIYGDMTTKQVKFGDSTYAAGLTFDLSHKTDSARGAVGTTAQRPTCDATLIGAQRWNTDDSALEFCSGTAWVRPALAPAGGTAPTRPLNNGYFVLTSAEWDGNLGGLVGANDKCYNDLTANNWMGKTTASANGQLTRMNIKAFICTSPGGSGNCTNGVPFATYYFARSGEPAAGGASFMADASGFGPGNNANWGPLNYFFSSAEFWSDRSAISTTRWGDGDIAWMSWGGDVCANWTSNSSSKFASFGSVANTGYARWAGNGYGSGRTCNSLLRLVCWVHP